MDSFLKEILDDVASVGGPWLVVAAFLLAFGETALFTDLLVPGEIGLVILGAAAARGGEPNLAVLIAASAVGATLGDSVGWLLGRHVGTRLVDHSPRFRRRFNVQIERAHVYFDHRGGGAVFWGRFVGAFRAVVSVVAGMSGMPYRRFFWWNVLASVGWTGLVVSLGYVFGRSVGSTVGDVGLVVTVVIVVGLSVWWLVRWRRQDT
jgi:membrane protein DedA with SNARE-associated domain